MNNLKKVGLTALAGSLALTAAHAGEMSVSGSMVATYNKRDTKESTGNPFGMKTNLTFSGSSELDNGMTASMFTTSSDKFAGQYSGKISLDMGDAGTIALDQASGGGAYMVDDKMPTAYEESWDNLDAAYTAGKMDYTHTGGINYTNTFSDVAVDLLYRKGGSATNSDGGTTAGSTTGNVKSLNLKTSALMDGLSMGLGYQTIDTFADGDDEESTFYVTYASEMGLSVGFQVYELDDAATANSDEDSDMMGVAYSVNDNLSISYGVKSTDFTKSGAGDTMKTTGIGAAYSSGGITLSIQKNEGECAGGYCTSSNEDENLEVAVSFAF
jgi:outer membrane protein OmpU